MRTSADARHASAQVIQDGVEGIPRKYRTVERGRAARRLRLHRRILRHEKAFDKGGIVRSGENTASAMPAADS